MGSVSASSNIAEIASYMVNNGSFEYDYDYHYYSSTYTNSCGNIGQFYYSLDDAKNRLKNGGTIYIDCFGFVRLACALKGEAVGGENDYTRFGRSSGWTSFTGSSGTVYAYALNNRMDLRPGDILVDNGTHVAIVDHVANNGVIYFWDSGSYKSGAVALRNTKTTTYYNWNFFYRF